MVPWEV
jgi:hypothetical protein